MKKLVISLTAFGMAVVITATLSANEVNSGVFQTPAGGWGVGAPPAQPQPRGGR